ncbi:MAG: hypothetical protein NZ555_10260 [Geminicoccaceae bacterium]|nr:hypothetical protein [Geminicoccaceae bacterium]MCX8099615.1 hypothetical protein [Geminicoccaceae bacterium]MDW8369183.1 hypothetical protein [Geminicoccaceae bacterium]
MSEPRVPASLDPRHKAALEQIARSFGCPEQRLLDEAIELYLKRLGLAELVAETDPEQRTVHRSESHWSAVLR